MVIDTSAILAILFNEAERRLFNERIAADAIRLVSAASYLETAIIVNDRLGFEGARDLRLFFSEADIEVGSVTFEQAEVAREAYRKYGRGNHPAGLNFADCFSCALAKVSKEPLLFKGKDFSQTDIPAVV
ncbi:MAG: type II toxin-antitoxin system VapC family toxin [Candidatus Binataceae bacterium]